MPAKLIEINYVHEPFKTLSTSLPFRRDLGVVRFARKFSAAAGTTCPDVKNGGLHNQSGAFLCTVPSGKTRFTQHGPVRVSPDNRYLVHADQTPFFYLADTAWNGALLSTPGEWDQYTRERARQKF